MFCESAVRRESQLTSLQLTSIIQQGRLVVRPSAIRSKMEQILFLSFCLSIPSVFLLSYNSPSLFLSISSCSLPNLSFLSPFYYLHSDLFRLDVAHSFQILTLTIRLSTRIPEADVSSTIPFIPYFHHFLFFSFSLRIL